jgi:hypothetical protein
MAWTFLGFSLNSYRFGFLNKKEPLSWLLTGLFVGGLFFPAPRASARCVDFLNWKRLFASTTPSSHQGILIPPPGAELYPLRAEYSGEERVTVTYMTAEQAQAAQAVIDQGLFKDEKGALLCTGPEGCTGIFVVDEKGRLYFSTSEDRLHFHHSSFVAGRPVVFAGEMTLKDGRLLEVDKESGHYRPPLRAFKVLIEMFAHVGVHGYQIGIPVTDGTSKDRAYGHRLLGEEQVLRLFQRAPEAMNRKSVLFSDDFEELLKKL